MILLSRRFLAITETIFISVWKFSFWGTEWNHQYNNTNFLFGSDTISSDPNKLHITQIYPQKDHELSLNRPHKLPDCDLMQSDQFNVMFSSDVESDPKTCGCCSWVKPFLFSHHNYEFCSRPCISRQLSSVNIFYGYKTAINCQRNFITRKLFAFIMNGSDWKVRQTKTFKLKTLKTRNGRIFQNKT